MRRFIWTFAALAAASWLLGAVPAFAQAPGGTEAMPSGSGLFATYCAVCHGANAKGTGPLADSMKRRPADLTLIASRNGGTFDKEMVKRIIDGKNPVKGHGGGDMPVWGDAFARSADAATHGVGARIEALADYIATLQVK